VDKDDFKDADVTVGLPPDDLFATESDFFILAALYSPKLNFFVVLG
jgi:hypothetical protein